MIYVQLQSIVEHISCRVGSKKSTAKKSTFPNRRFFDYRFFAPRVFISIFCQYGLYVGFMVLMVSNVEYLSRCRICFDMKYNMHIINILSMK